MRGSLVAKVAATPMSMPRVVSVTQAAETSVGEVKMAGEMRVRVTGLSAGARAGAKPEEVGTVWVTCPAEAIRSSSVDPLPKIVRKSHCCCSDRRVKEEAETVWAAEEMRAAAAAARLTTSAGAAADPRRARRPSARPIPGDERAAS